MYTDLSPGFDRMRNQLGQRGPNDNSVATHTTPPCHRWLAVSDRRRVTPAADQRAGLARLLTAGPKSCRRSEWFPAQPALVRNERLSRTGHREALPVPRRDVAP